VEPNLAQGANDTCAGALPITLDGSVEGTNLAAHDDYGTSGVSGACSSGPYNGPDVVYSFVAPANATYAFGLDVFDVTVWATTSCGSEAHCVADASTGWTFVGSSGTTYSFIVDTGAGAPACDFNLSEFQQ
jgi:hypothetical protein